MLCYKDKTFCSDTKCKNSDCSMLLDQQIKNNAAVWWNGTKDLKEWTKPPIMTSNYKDTQYCPGFR